MIKLSIITIAYNNREGLNNTIESVINQTVYDQIEYVVIDGDSKDGSKELLQKYSDRLSKWISEPDTGIYNAMNKGARLSTGEYMLFLNSGDTLNNNKVVESVLNQLTGEEIICGRVINYFGDDAKLKIPPENVSLFTFTGGSLPHPSAFISRKLFDKIGGYDESYRIISDWCFFVIAILKENCTYKTIEDVITNFIRDGISSTSGHLEESKKHDFLIAHFGRIIDDYLETKDEAISNCGYWISQNHNISGRLFRFIFKSVNRIMKLRNRLSRRMGVVQIERKYER